MPRPRRRRRIRKRTDIELFKPAGIPRRELETVDIGHDEVEAIRLKDYEGKSQKEAADDMDVSQPTFSRLLKEARKKMAEAVSQGKALAVEGGHYRIEDE